MAEHERRRSKIERDKRRFTCLSPTRRREASRSMRLGARGTAFLNARNARTNVVYRDEAFTSKTCGKCGGYHACLGARKVFICPHCGNVEERDGGAARKILLCWLRDVSSDATTTKKTNTILSSDEEEVTHGDHQGTAVSDRTRQSRIAKDFSCRIT